MGMLIAFLFSSNEAMAQNSTPETKWDHGREYKLFFVAKELGTYHLTCSDHAPNMAATLLYYRKNEAGAVACGSLHAYPSV